MLLFVVVYPVSNGDRIINHIFCIYEALHKCKPVDVGEDELILFPVGVVNIPPNKGNTTGIRELITTQVNQHFSDKFKNNLQDPDYCCSTIMYTYLDLNLWSSSHENLPDLYVPQYIAQLKKIIGWLNTAKVSHNDILPRNILWSIQNEQLCLLLIDFEDSCFFGESHLRATSNDNRYPFRYKILASKEANYFFQYNVEQFIKQRETFSFVDFMNAKFSELYKGFFEIMTAMRLEVGQNPESSDISQEA